MEQSPSYGAGYLGHAHTFDWPGTAQEWQVAVQEVPPVQGVGVQDGVIQP